MIKKKYAPWQVSLLSAMLIVALNNGGLISDLYSKLNIFSIRGAGFLLFIALTMIFVLCFLILVLGVGRMLKPVIAAFFLASAIVGYFTNQLGIVFDLEMIRNIVEAMRDGNSMEAMELISGPFAVHLFIFGVLPSIAVVNLALQPARPLLELRNRSLLLLIGLLSVLSIGLADFKYITYFSVENRDLRYEALPIVPILSAAKFVKREFWRRPAFHKIGEDAAQQKPISRRTVGVMVVGESARADHFSLNGYARNTNPGLSREKGLGFYEIKSCGTSTAYSVPCIFSLRGRETYSVQQAPFESNILDVLASAGVKTIWVDNNSSCKKVCNRIENVNLRQYPDQSSPLYSDGGYFDEVLIGQLDRYLNADNQDLLIVLHSMGSHGPAYSRRYPEQDAVFVPSCGKKSPKECSDSEVVNAYDNTIVYTDRLLCQIIDHLKVQEDVDTFLLYVSDHGESLGEGGVYLHGLPYSIAPKAQTEVPMIIWLSPDYAADHGVDAVQNAANHDHHWSHDNVSHTLLGLFDVTTSTYEHDMDVLHHSAS